MQDNALQARFVLTVVCWRMMSDRGELVAIVSMDLSKAFDVIQYPLLLSQLRAYGNDGASCAVLW